MPSFSTPAGRPRRRTRRSWSSTSPATSSPHPNSQLKLVLIGAGRRAHPGAPVARHPRPRLRLRQDKADAYAASPRALPAVAARELLARHDGGLAGRHAGARPRAVRGDAGSLPRLERRALLRRTTSSSSRRLTPGRGRGAPPADGRGRARLRPRQLHLGSGDRQLPRPSSAGWGSTRVTRLPFRARPPVRVELRPGRRHRQPRPRAARLLRSWGYASDVYAQYRHEELVERRSLLHALSRRCPRPTRWCSSTSPSGRRSRASSRACRTGAPSSTTTSRRPSTSSASTRGSPTAAGAGAGSSRAWPVTELALGVSEFNRQELEAAGFRRTGVLPILVDWDQYAAPAGPALEEAYGRGTTLLFVGRRRSEQARRGPRQGLLLLSTARSRRAG